MGGFQGSKDVLTGEPLPEIKAPEPEKLATDIQGLQDQLKKYQDRVNELKETKKNSMISHAEEEELRNSERIIEEVKNKVFDDFKKSVEGFEDDELVLEISAKRKELVSLKERLKALKDKKKYIDETRLIIGKLDTDKISLISSDYLNEITEEISQIGEIEGRLIQDIIMLSMKKRAPEASLFLEKVDEIRDEMSKFLTMLDHFNAAKHNGSNLLERVTEDFWELSLRNILELQHKIDELSPKLKLAEDSAQGFNMRVDDESITEDQVISQFGEVYGETQDQLKDLEQKIKKQLEEMRKPQVSKLGSLLKAEHPEENDENPTSDDESVPDDSTSTDEDELDGIIEENDILKNENPEESPFEGETQKIEGWIKEVEEFDGAESLNEEDRKKIQKIRKNLEELSKKVLGEEDKDKDKVLKQIKKLGDLLRIFAELPTSEISPALEPEPESLEITMENADAKIGELWEEYKKLRSGFSQEDKEKLQLKITEMKNFLEQQDEGDTRLSELRKNFKTLEDGVARDLKEPIKPIEPVESEIEVSSADIQKLIDDANTYELKLLMARIGQHGLKNRQDENQGYYQGAFQRAYDDLENNSKAMEELGKMEARDSAAKKFEVEKLAKILKTKEEEITKLLWPEKEWRKLGIGGMKRLGKKLNDVWNGVPKPKINKPRFGRLDIRRRFGRGSKEQEAEEQSSVSREIKAIENILKTKDTAEGLKNYDRQRLLAVLSMAGVDLRGENPFFSGTILEKLDETAPNSKKLKKEFEAYLKNNPDFVRNIESKLKFENELENKVGDILYLKNLSDLNKENLTPEDRKKLNIALRVFGNFYKNEKEKNSIFINYINQANGDVHYVQDDSREAGSIAQQTQDTISQFNNDEIKKALIDYFVRGTGDNKKISKIGSLLGYQKNSNLPQ